MCVEQKSPGFFIRDAVEGYRSIFVQLVVNEPEPGAGLEAHKHCSCIETLGDARMAYSF